MHQNGGEVKCEKKLWVAGVVIAAILVAFAIFAFHVTTQNVKPPGWRILNAPRVELRNNISVTSMLGERKNH